MHNLEMPAWCRAGKAIKDSSSIYGGLTAWQHTTSQNYPCHLLHLILLAGPATRAMLQAADLTSAAAVFEFGCG